MGYKCCKYIQSGISFRHDAVSICNKVWGTKRYEDFNIPYEGDFYKKFLDVREKAIENCKNGILPHEGCQSCIYVEDKDWDDNAPFKEIELTHWVHCNCACCYCAMKPVTNGEISRKQNSPYVRMYPIVKKMLQENKIDQNAFFSITGGEVTMLKEFPDILKLLLKQKNTSYGFCLQTNGIEYEKLFAKALKKDNRSVIVISTDCASRELFRKMKRVDKFDNVVKNIKRYIKDSEPNGDGVVVKYIIMPNVNDNKEEIDKWIKLCKDLGVRTLQPAIEFCSQVVQPGMFTPKLAELYNYMKEQIEVNNFKMITYDFLEQIVENQSYDITKK